MLADGDPTLCRHSVNSYCLGTGPVFSIRYIVGFRLFEMVISTNLKPCTRIRTQVILNTTYHVGEVTLGVSEVSRTPAVDGSSNVLPGHHGQSERSQHEHRVATIQPVGEVVSSAFVGVLQVREAAQQGIHDVSLWRCPGSKALQVSKNKCFEGVEEQTDVLQMSKDRCIKCSNKQLCWRCWRTITLKVLNEGSVLSFCQWSGCIFHPPILCKLFVVPFSNLKVKLLTPFHRKKNIVYFDIIHFGLIPRSALAWNILIFDRVQNLSLFFTQNPPVYFVILDATLPSITPVVTGYMS